MAEREAEVVVEKGGISRRKLLKLAAYSVPTAALVNVTSTARVLAMSHGGPPCFKVRPAGEGEVGFLAVCCPDSPPHWFDPTHCDRYIAVPEEGFVFDFCGGVGAGFIPAENVCYTWEACGLPGCYMPIPCV